MKVIDPVCGMTLEPGNTTLSETYQGRTYFLCSPTCQRSFKADPGKFAPRADAAVEHATRNVHRHR